MGVFSVYPYLFALSLLQGATDRQIKKKYRELSLLHHPDRNANDPEAEEKFVRIAKAYQA